MASHVNVVPCPEILQPKCVPRSETGQTDILSPVTCTFDAYCPIPTHSFMHAAHRKQREARYMYSETAQVLRPRSPG